MPWQTAALEAGSALAGWILVMLLFRVLSSPSGVLGVQNGRLASCPPTPNCVCTHDTGTLHHITPLTFNGSLAEAMTRLKSVLERLPRVRILHANGDYLRAEFRSLLFRFVDDVEFLIDDAAKVIHFRSASRAGRSDLGVNRRRMEMIRRSWQS